MTTETLEPIVNNLNRPFWEAAREGVLLLPCCVDSDRPFWPPSPISPFTGGAVAWRPAEPIGTIVAAVTYTRVFQRLLADHMPFGVALIELAQGVRLQVHMANPAQATPGDRARIVFRPLHTDGTPVPVILEPAGTQSS